MRAQPSTLYSVARYFSRRFGKELGVLSVLGFLGSLLGGIGVSAIIPLLSILIRGVENTNDAATRFVVKVLEYLPFPTGVASLLFLIVGIFLARAILLFSFNYVRLKIRQEYRREEMDRIFSGLLMARWRFLLEQKIGHLQNTLLRDIEMSSRFLETFGNIMLSFTSAIIYFIFAILISSKLTILVLLLGMLLVPLSRILMKKTKATEEQLLLQDRFISQYITEHLFGIKTIKGIAAEETISKKGEEYFRTWNDLALKKYALISIGNSTIEPFNVIFVVAAFALSYQVVGFSLETFAATMLLIQRLFSSLQSFMGSWQAIYEQIPHVLHVVDFGKTLGREKESKGEGKLFVFQKDIAFSNVSLSYEKSPEVLSGINFSVPKGEIIGIIGPSGAGKTSLADLILRLFDPTKGDICLDGENIKRFGINEWRTHVGYVSQDIFLINDTIENNIRFYNGTLSKKEVEAAARQANIHGFIVGLIDGFNTVVGDRGVMLSGGQRQRIALARVLARKPDILVLDEATSALDNESEVLVQEAIRGLRGKVTVFMIAHRLSTILSVDRLLVLDKGRIIEEGKPDILLQNTSSYFYKMSHLKDKA